MAVECAETTLMLLNDFFYYEFESQVTHLQRIKIVETLNGCTPEIQCKREFAQLITNMTMLNTPELVQVGTNIMLDIFETSLVEVMIENFLKSEQMLLQLEGAIFLSKFVIHLNKLCEEHVQMRERVGLQLIKAVLQVGNGLFFDLAVFVFERAEYLNPKTVIAACETIFYSLQMAHGLDLEAVFEAFEKQGCLDAIENLTVDPRTEIRSFAIEIVTLYNDLPRRSHENELQTNDGPGK